jgi:hypothetical protein
MRQRLDPKLFNDLLGKDKRYLVVIVKDSLSGTADMA